jgi:hypothetical protein
MVGNPGTRTAPATRFTGSPTTGVRLFSTRLRCPLAPGRQLTPTASAYGENDDHTVTLNPPSGSVVAYAGPAPPSGTGPHRYISLVYAQPSDFKVPSTPAVGSGPVLFESVPLPVHKISNWPLLTSVTSSLEKYKTESGLGKAIAGTYFTVEEGTATISIAATQPVDSTTLPQYTPTSTGGAVAGARILKEVGLALAGGLLLI